MEKEVAQNPIKFPFSKTQEFVQRFYEASFIGEQEIPPFQLDPDKPHTIIGDTVYDTQFAVTLVRGQEFLLISSSIDSRNNPDQYGRERNTHIALNYLMSGMTLQKVGDMEGITRERVR